MQMFLNPDWRKEMRDVSFLQSSLTYVKPVRPYKKINKAQKISCEITRAVQNLAKNIEFMSECIVYILLLIERIGSKGFLSLLSLTFWKNTLIHFVATDLMKKLICLLSYSDG